METEKEIRAEACLREAGVDFIRIEHAKANTMELCRGIGAEYCASHCKNLLLVNRSGTEFHLLLMEPDKPYRTSEVSKKLGVSRLSFASPEQLRETLCLEPGSVSILGMTNECAEELYKKGRLSIAIDSDLLKRDRICVHPNADTATLVLSVKELMRFLEFRGFSAAVVDI
ncbi:MAG: prolyl-tRNA synthetase associated domain-containing protein [Clostridiales bacterium]|nr:prolyl-tRNA synthetase associated domain-containing protein [Clostridiales bacterium]